MIDFFSEFCSNVLKVLLINKVNIILWNSFLGITYLEVYNELVKDLLNPGPPLNLREDSNYGVIVAGIKFYKISNAFELFSLLEQGNINRTQHPTDANAESSRSHAVFQVYLKMTVKLSKEVFFPEFFN